MSRHNKNELALAMLVRLINEGREYPDAAWEVEKTYGLSVKESEAMNEAYMDYCARGCEL